MLPIRCVGVSTHKLSDISSLFHILSYPILWYFKDAGNPQATFVRCPRSEYTRKVVWSVILPSVSISDFDILKIRMAGNQLAICIRCLRSTVTRNFVWSVILPSVSYSQLWHFDSVQIHIEGSDYKAGDAYLVVTIIFVVFGDHIIPEVTIILICFFLIDLCDLNMLTSLVPYLQTLVSYTECSWLTIAVFFS